MTDLGRKHNEIRAERRLRRLDEDVFQILRRSGVNIGETIQQVAADGIGGVGPFWYDAMVDFRYSGTPGTIYVPINGHSFRMYTEVQDAIDYVMSVGGPADGTGETSILIAPGTYPGRLTIDGSGSGLSINDVHIFGSGKHMTTIGDGTELPHQLNGIIPSRIHFYDLSINTSALLLVHAGVGSGFKLTCHEVRFLSTMTGSQDGSNFYDCDFTLGWIPQSGEGNIDNVIIIGGTIDGAFNFSINNIGMNNWHVDNVRLGITGAFRTHSCTGSYFNVWKSTGVAGGTFIFEGITTDITITGSPGQASLSSSVIRFAGSTNEHRGVHISCSFFSPVAVNATTHFVSVDSDSKLTASHIDIQAGKTSGGDYIETLGGVSVRGVFEETKFTFAPVTIMKVETLAGSSNNKLDSGIIEFGSVGIDPIQAIERIFSPDVARDIDVAVGDQQGPVYHSGNVAETVHSIYLDAGVAPTDASLICEIEYGDTDDLDTVAVWTLVDTITLATTVQSVKETTFTDPDIPANRLIRFNVTQVGSTEPGENVSCIVKSY